MTDGIFQLDAREIINLQVETMCTSSTVSTTVDLGEQPLANKILKYDEILANRKRNLNENMMNARRKL